MVADCLAQLACMSPAPLAAWLLKQLSCDSVGARGVAVAAMKYALNDSAHDASHLTQCAPVSPSVREPSHRPVLAQRLGRKPHEPKRGERSRADAVWLVRYTCSACQNSMLS